MDNEDEFVIKIKADDSEARKTIDKLHKDASLKPIVIDIKGRIDPGLQKTLANIQHLKARTGAGNGTNDFLVRSQRNAAKAVNTFSTSVISATTALSAFVMRLTKKTIPGAGIVSGGMGFGGSSSGLGKVANIFGQGLMAFPGATQLAHYAMAPLRRAFNFGNTSIGAYNTQNRAELQLQQVLKNNGMGDSEFNSIKNYASELQSRTTIGDEAMLAGAGELSTYVKDGESMKRMMKLLSDYAIGMNENNPEVNSHMMVDFATGLGKAFDGVYDSMRKKGFDTSELEALSEREKNGEEISEGDKIAALERALKDWNGLAENIANTDEGKIIQLNNTIGDMKENVGRELLPSLGKLGEVLHQYLPSIQNFFDAYKNAAKWTIEAGAKLLELGKPFVKLFSDFVVVLSEHMAPVMGGVVVGVGTLTFALAKMQAQMMKTAITAMTTSNGGLSGLTASIGKLNTSVSSVAKAGLWGILAAEILSIGDAAYQAWSAAKEARENNDKYNKTHNSDALMNAYRRFNDAKNSSKGAYEESMELQKEAMKFYKNTGTLPENVAKAVGMEDWIKKDNGKSAAPAAPKVAPPPPVKITQNNYVSTDFDSLGKLIKENLREIAISRMTFKTSAEAAKAMAS